MLDGDWVIETVGFGVEIDIVTIEEVTTSLGITISVDLEVRGVTAGFEELDVESTAATDMLGE